MEEDDEPMAPNPSLTRENLEFRDFTLNFYEISKKLYPTHL